MKMRIGSVAFGVLLVGCAGDGTGDRDGPTGSVRQEASFPSNWYEVNDFPGTPAFTTSFRDTWKQPVAMRLPDDGAFDPINANETRLGSADPAVCTATLVGPRTMISASHCDFAPGDLVIFGYEVSSSGNDPSYQVPAETYRVSSVLETTGSTGSDPFDYMVFNIRKRPTSVPTHAGPTWNKLETPGSRFGFATPTANYQDGMDVAAFMHPWKDIKDNDACPTCPAKIMGIGHLSLASEQIRVDWPMHGGESGTSLMTAAGRIVGILNLNYGSSGARGPAMAEILDYSQVLSDTVCDLYDPSEFHGSGQCTGNCRCDVWEGGCNSNGQCAPGLTCQSVPSGEALYGAPNGGNLCVDPTCPTFNPLNPDWTPGCRIGAGEGDCDTDEDCGGSLICKQNIGKAVHANASASLDICDYPPDPGCGSRANCAPDCCTPDCPCGLGEGDCERDVDCRPGLICLENVGANFGRESWVDVCTMPAAEASSCQSDSDCTGSQHCMENAGTCTDGGYSDLCENNADCNQGDCCNGSSNCNGAQGCQCHAVCD